jgi:hypothetical protein
MRLERNTAVLFKPETIYGTDSVPAAATDALLLRKFTCKPLDAKYVNVPEIRPYMGGALDLVGASWVSGSFDISLGGSGTAGTVTQWGDILRASGFAEVVTAATRVDYTLISTALESASMYYYDDGVLKKVLGQRCNITSFKMGFGDVPQMSVAFIGLDGGETAVAPPALTLTAWKPPVPVNSANSGLLTLGCTYSAGALTGGTTYPSQGLEFSLGGKMSYMDILGGETVDFTDRDVTGKITLDLTAAQEISNSAIVKAGTTTGLGLVHGTVAGHKLLVFMPNVQLKNPAKVSLNGRRLISYDINPVPTAGTGNDEVRIVTL